MYIVSEASDEFANLLICYFSDKLGQLFQNGEADKVAGANTMSLIKKTIRLFQAPSDEAHYCHTYLEAIMNLLQLIIKMKDAKTRSFTFDEMFSKAYKKVYDHFVKTWEGLLWGKNYGRHRFHQDLH